MKKRFLWLLLAAALLAGCNGGASGPEASSAVEGDGAAPARTYVDPAPDMVLATMPDGVDLTYEGYRLYVDVTEGLDYDFARQDLALSAALEKDLAAMGETVDELDYVTAASRQVAQYYNEDAVDKLREVTGMDTGRLVDAMKMTYRPQYLLDILYARFAEEAAAALPEPETPAESEPAGSSSEGTDPEASAAQAEYERQMAVAEAADARLDAYYNAFFERCDFSNDDVLVRLDGEDLPFEQSHRDFIRYISMADRLNLLTSIQSGEIMLREMTRMGVDLTAGEEAFESQYTGYVDSIKNAPEYLAALDLQLEKLGATRDDYYACLRRPMWLQHIGYEFAQAIVAEYAALPADAPDRPETEEAYYLQRVEKLAEGSELVNLPGK